MESRPAFLHPSRNDESKTCYGSESKPSGQLRKGNISPGTRTRLGENHGIEVEAKEQEEGSNSRESAGHVKTLKHTALATTPSVEPLPVSTAASRIPTMHSATTKQVVARTVNTTAMTKIVTNQPNKAAAPGLEVLGLSSQPQPSGTKLRSPNASHEKKLQVSAKTFPKNIQKTPSVSHIMGSADSPQKMLYKTASASQISSHDSPKSLNRHLSHIPRVTSSPKLKLTHPGSLKLDKTERNRKVTGKEGQLSTSPIKDKMIDVLVESKLQPGAKPAGESPQGRKEQEKKSGIEREGEMLGDEREDTVLQGRDLTVMSLIGCKQTSSLSSKLATDPSSPEQLKEPEDKTDANVTTQERYAGNSQRRKGKEEAETEERRQAGERKVEVEIKREKMATEVKKDAENKMQMNDAEIKKGLPETETKDAALQVDLHPVFTDVEVQAVMEVCSRSTDMSPVHDSQPETDLNPKTVLHNDLNPKTGLHNDLNPKTVLHNDLNPKTGLHNDLNPKTVLHNDLNPKTVLHNDLNPKAGLHNDLNPKAGLHNDLNPRVGLNNDLNPKTVPHNDLNPDNNSTPDLRPMGAKPRFLGPPPYKSPNKPLQHVCQIEIELHSQSPQTLDPVPLKVTVSEFDTTCQLLPKTRDDSSKPLNSGRTGEVDGDKEENGAPQQLFWDEQGMTWEVYGASLDMESLGFAIQNHLQCKIREHERRIGTLRKSICLSEQSARKERTGKKKRNVFRSLFLGSNCCSKPQPKEELPM